MVEIVANELFTGGKIYSLSHFYVSHRFLNVYFYTCVNQPSSSRTRNLICFKISHVNGYTAHCVEFFADSKQGRIKLRCGIRLIILLILPLWF